MRSMGERPHQLASLDYLGDAIRFAQQIHALIPKCPLLENFSTAEVRQLAHFMEVYRAEPGMEIIREGEGGDFMMMVVEGKVDVNKRDRWNTPQPIAQVEAGRTLGEMSMIDGEPRFATCVAVEKTVIAVLDRENLARMQRMGMKPCVESRAILDRNIVGIEPGDPLACFSLDFRDVWQAVYIGHE
jgi:CRP/FNR family transcriptional regulator, cyclic AMP receptor protein